MRKLLLKLRALVRSIASLPTLIFFGFVLLAIAQLSTTDDAQRLPDWLAPYNLGDLDTIRALLAAVITGVFTLTIFAYTMVMNVLDRSISSYSPRLLPLILSERYHQEILGVGAGTIAHSTILLLGVADPPDFAKPPVLAAVSAAFFALVSLVLFIFFIHRVSRSIHVNALLRKSYEHTRSRINKLVEQGVTLANAPVDASGSTPRIMVSAKQCGYLDELDFVGLVNLSTRLGAPVHLLPRPGSFVQVGEPILAWDSKVNVKDYESDGCYSVSENEPIDVYATGFKHLVEVAIKAASPAINDPGTSMTAINYLGQLFVQLTAIKPYNSATDGRGTLCLDNQWQFADLLDSCFNQLREYLASDPWGSDTMRKNLQRIAVVCSAAGDEEGSASARRQIAALTRPPASSVPGNGPTGRHFPG